MKENWKDIKGFEGYYQVSNLGRIKSFAMKGRGNNSVDRFITCSINTLGYRTIKLCKDAIETSVSVHTLVAEHFIPRPRRFLSKRAIINHINGRREDNRVDNLEYLSYSENSIHGRMALLFIDGEIKLNRMVYLDNIVKTLFKSKQL
jgi:hypothetical protein